MMFAAAEAIPFTVEVSELTSEVKTFEVTADVVAATPLTVVVIVLPEVVAELVVDDATMPASDVVEVTPFTFEVSTVPEVESAFEFTDVVVLTIPLTVEVTTFAAEVMVFVVGVMSDDVATHVGTPATIERTVPAAPGAYGAATFDAFPTKMLPSASGRLGRTEKVVVANVDVPLTVKLLFKKRFVPVALPKRRLVMFARVEKKLVVVALVVVLFVAVRFVTLSVSKVNDPMFDAVRNGVAVALAEVIRPCASTVITGMVVDDPNVPADTPVLVSEKTGF